MLTRAIEAQRREKHNRNNRNEIRVLSRDGVFCQNQTRTVVVVVVVETKKTQITFLLFRLCLSRRCGSIARVNTRNRANARALESFLVVPSVLSTSPTCRIERALSDT